MRIRKRLIANLPNFPILKALCKEQINPFLLGQQNSLYIYTLRRASQPHTETVRDRICYTNTYRNLVLWAPTNSGRAYIKKKKITHQKQRNENYEIRIHETRKLGNTNRGQNTILDKWGNGFLTHVQKSTRAYKYD